LPIVSKLLLSRVDTRYSATIAIHLNDVQNIDFLHKDEAIFYNTLKNPKVRKNFLAGRLCAKAALVDNFQLEKSLIYISHGVFDFPIVKEPVSLSSLQVSIGHSFDIAVAIAFPAEFPMAVDLEKIRAEKIATIERLLTSNEQSMLAKISGDQIDKTIACWAHKESLAKVLKCGLQANLNIFELSTFEQYPNYIVVEYKNFFQYKSISFKVKDYILAIVLPKKTNLDNIDAVLRDLNSI